MTEEREIHNLKERLSEIRTDLRELDKAHLTRYHSLKSDVAAVNLLVEQQHRANILLDEHDDRLAALERNSGGTDASLRRYDDRLAKLEAMNIAVIADRLDRLSRQVNWVIGSFVTLILSVLTGIIVFLVAGVGS